MKVPEELLLLVLLHGFKGGADTFAAFPDRVVHTLSVSQPRVQVQAIVYPPYDTRGELITAVDNHVNWLTTTVAERKAEYSAKGGQGPTRVVLLGHSMGGLVVADTVLSTLSSAALPILGVIGYDTPYLGLHPAVFKNTFDKALGYASQGQAALAALGVGYGYLSGGKKNGSTSPTGGGSKIPPATASPSSSSSKTVAQSNDTTTAKKSGGWLSLQNIAAAAAGMGAIGAAGAAYLHRDVISTQVTWATSHLSFVGELWKADELQRRMDKLVAVKEIGFHCFYTYLPPKKDVPARTFCVLPTAPPALKAAFTPNPNTRADNEIAAHIEMFTEKSDGMYSLGTSTCELLTEWLEEARAGRMGVEAKVAAGEKMDREEKHQQARQV